MSFLDGFAGLAHRARSRILATLFVCATGTGCGANIEIEASDEDLSALFPSAIFYLEIKDGSAGAPDNPDGYLNLAWTNDEKRTEVVAENIANLTDDLAQNGFTFVESADESTVKATLQIKSVRFDPVGGWISDDARIVYTSTEDEETLGTVVADERWGDADSEIGVSRADERHPSALGSRREAVTEVAKAIIVLSVIVAVSVAYYFVFFSGESEDRYFYWDGTITFVWIDAAEQQRDYGVGRGRYEVRLPNGTHVEARTHLDARFARFDCVRVRQLLAVNSYAPSYEIVDRVDACWQPDQDLPD